ncbi:MAG: hypothetical protein AB2564_00385 [Candidatus Thiodiazotropha sp.]
MSNDKDSLDPVAQAAVDKIEAIAKKYKQYGFSAITVAAGVALMIFTFIVAIRTNPSDPSATLFNVSETEALLFLSAGILLAALGGANLIVKNMLINRLDALDIQVRIESIKVGTKNLELLKQATEAINESNRLLSNQPRRGPADG